jgi:hypothetical protein
MEPWAPWLDSSPPFPVCMMIYSSPLFKFRSFVGLKASIMAFIRILRGIYGATVEVGCAVEKGAAASVILQIGQVVKLFIREQESISVFSKTLKMQCYRKLSMIMGCNSKNDRGNFPCLLPLRVLFQFAKSRAEIQH